MEKAQPIGLKELRVCATLEVRRLSVGITLVEESML